MEGLLCSMLVRIALFVATSGIAVDAADYFNVPLERTVLVGSVVEV